MDVMKRGAVFIDDSDYSTSARLLFYIEDAIQDGMILKMEADERFPNTSTWWSWTSKERQSAQDTRPILIIGRRMNRKRRRY